MSENYQSEQATELCNLIEYIASRLVTDPDQISVTAEEQSASVRIHLNVPEDDMGKVIGREGRIARAMRTVLMIGASRRGFRSSLDIDS